MAVDLGGNLGGHQMQNVEYVQYYRHVSAKTAYVIFCVLRKTQKTCHCMYPLLHHKQNNNRTKNKWFHGIQCVDMI